jgi:hypothetical protein
MAHSKESVMIEFAKFIDQFPPGTKFSLMAGSAVFRVGKLFGAV